MRAAEKIAVLFMLVSGKIVRPHFCGGSAYSQHECCNTEHCAPALNTQTHTSA